MTIFRRRTAKTGIGPECLFRKGEITLVTALKGTTTVLTALITAHAALKVALAAWDAEEAKMGPVVQG